MAVSPLPSPTTLLEVPSELPVHTFVAGMLNPQNRFRIKVDIKGQENKTMLGEERE